MSSMFCCSFLISTCQRYLLVGFDTKCDAKSGNSLSSKKNNKKTKEEGKKNCLHPSGIKYDEQPHLWKF